jgi:putative ABC transport system permease protein
MNEIFGMPVATMMVGLLFLLGLSLLAVAWIAWRRPVIFKLGMRNVPRRKAQTVLIVVGLMLSTLIISASLGTGDTMDHSVSSGVYDLTGQVDEIVVYSQDVEADANTYLSQTIPSDSISVVEQALAGNSNVEAIAPILVESVPVKNDTRQLAEPDVMLTGFDPASVESFGGLVSTDGNAVQLETLADDEVVLSASAAEQLDASPGDQLTVFYGNQPVALTVAAIAPDSALTGVMNPDTLGMVMPLQQLQSLTGQADRISLVAISNSGGVRDGMALSDEVGEALAPALQGSQLGVNLFKQDGVEQAEELAETFTSVFLIFGLFSIAAGILLIVLIFTMLAAERRSEMGMARAVGAQRPQLTQQFVAEGMGYALIAGLIGSALGVVASAGIAYGMKVIVGDIFDVQPYIAPRSLVIAYSLGAVITFIAVAVASWKISRLNVVAAIRDIPDAEVATRKKGTLVWGVLMTLAGAFLTMSGLSGDVGSSFYIGMSLLPFGISQILRFLGMSGRPVLTVVGLYVMVLWLLPEDVANALFGLYDAGIEMFFLSGVFMVAATTLIIVQNLGTLLGLLTRVGSVFRSRLPAVRTAVAYPGAARSRTGMTVAMFSLIVFSLVMVATLTANFSAAFLSDEGNAGWDVRADLSAGDTIEDFEHTLVARGMDTSQITNTAQVTVPNRFATQLRMPGTDEWKSNEVIGMSDAFMSGSTITFQQRADGYDSDEAILEALRTEPNVAVIDSFAIPTEGNFGGDDTLFLVEGLTSDDKTFEPTTVEVADPDSATPATVTIIGVIDSGVSTLHGLYTSQSTVDAIFPESKFTSWYVAIDDAADADQVAKDIEAALLSNGAQAVSVQDELEKSNATSAGLLYIMQGFMGLGLIVGVAAVGVIAFRSVVERRQQIGMVRALGFQRSLVAFSFVIESGFVVALGVIAGASTGLVLAYNLMHSESFGGSEDISFLVPWNLLGAIITATVVAALLMAWLPARQASRVAPAEALRYE